MAEILGKPGENRPIHVSESLPDVRVSLTRVEPDAKIAADLRLESVVEGVLATGTASAPAIFQCARCLTEFPGTVETEICELFAVPARFNAEEDSYRVEGDEIDLEPMLRDALTLALPLNPVCAEDCKGLCAHCGKEMTAELCDCTKETTDPRWAELDALREKLEST